MTDPTDPTGARVAAREVALGRLNDLTTWIAVGAVAAVGIFAVIAGQTIPGKASSSPSPSTTGSTSGAQTPATTTSGRHHHFDSSSVSSSSGPPMAVTGGSR